MEDKISLKEKNTDVDKIINTLLENNDLDIPDIPDSASDGLIAKLRDRDVPVLATPIAHG